MQDESQIDDRVIELIAKSLDEPLAPQEQDLVQQALSESPALRIVADGLLEFDALLQRINMAIPEEGFPTRVLARIEAYERRRTRTEWSLTLVVILLGWCTAAVWLFQNYSALLDSTAQLLLILVLLVPIGLTAFFLVMQAAGSGILLIYAFLVLALALIWARASGGLSAPRIRR